MNPAHEQIPLFGVQPSSSPRPLDRAPLARNTDPTSSHLAAAEITASGRRDSQKREILAALCAQSEPVTSMELARAAGIDRYTTTRRLPDLERDGLVERLPMRECSSSKDFDVVLIEEALPAADERWIKLIEFLLEAEPIQ